MIGELEGLVREYPLRETFRTQLMLALYRAGRQAEALEVYQDARARFIDELGIEPGPELKRLQSEILRHEAGLVSAGGPAPVDEEGEIVRALLAGRIVPVIGLDGAGDLAAHLASAIQVPDDRPVDLARVSQYVATMQGSGPLYDELHMRFEAAVEPGPLHRFLARLPALLRERGAPHQLIVTTNYDLALETRIRGGGGGARHRRLRRERPESRPLLASPARRAATPDRRSEHVRDGAEPRPADDLFKLHGAVDPLPEREWESFVITEDDYIDYLGRSELTAVVPVALAASFAGATSSSSVTTWPTGICA